MIFQYTLLAQLVGLLGLQTALSNFLYHALGFLGTAVILRPLLLDGLRRGKNHWKQLLSVCALALAGYYAAGWALSHLTAWLAPGFVNRNDQVFLSQGGCWGLLFATTVLFAPLSEECLFRGLLFAQLRQKSRWGAYTVSALCFCLIHVMGFLGQYSPAEFLLALVQYLPAGLILSWSEEKTNTLTAPILIHSIINAISAAQVLIHQL